MEFYTAERKEELLPFATAWMEPESIMLSEIKFLIVKPLKICQKKNGTNKIFKNRPNL